MQCQRIFQKSLTYELVTKLIPIKQQKINNIYRHTKNTNHGIKLIGNSYEKNVNKSVKPNKRTVHMCVHINGYKGDAQQRQ